MPPKPSEAFRKRPDGAGKDSRTPSQGHPVIADGNPSLEQSIHANRKLPVVDHASAALDGHSKTVQCGRKRIQAGHIAKRQIFAHGFLQGCRQLEPAYIMAIDLMRARFQHQNPVAVLQTRKGLASPDIIVKMPLLPGQADTETGQGDIRRQKLQGCSLWKH